MTSFLHILYCHACKLPSLPADNSSLGMVECQIWVSTLTVLSCASCVNNGVGGVTLSDMK